MSNVLNTKFRQWLDRIFVLSSGTISLSPAVSPAHALDNNLHKGSDLLFPLYSVIENGFVTPGTGLTVSIQGSLIRDGAGNVVELQPQASVLAFVAPASGKQTLYLVYYDTVASAFATVAGAAATIGTGVLPPVPAGGVPFAQVDMRNGDTTPAATRISNTARFIF